MGPGDDGNIRRAASGFFSGTLVHTKEGLMPIEKIKVGDWVLSKPESGEGEVSYKRVVNTFEFDDKEVWFVSYRWDVKLKPKEEWGDGFAIVTGNHPFWVVYESSFEEFDEDHEPVLVNRWMRADQLTGDETVLLADGSLACLIRVQKIYKTPYEGIGWLEFDEEGYGPVIDLRGDKAFAPLLGNRTAAYFSKVENDFYGYRVGNNRVKKPIYNPLLEYGVSYDEMGGVENRDFCFGNMDNRFYRAKVYNIEVGDNHTYFVDAPGVWSHNTGFISKG
ncbi:MAG: hypothetical protein Q8J78_04575 [Moraxellaceae bacterium]|nr:hypothetical protein [Moraxellaceae bacterium]